MKGLLVLEDGRVFAGESFAAAGKRPGEIVFNTSMTGYQEVLTDPSYKAQIVAMTYPHIGNYGVNPEDVESSRPQVEGFVVREYCPHPSNWRSRQSLGEYLTAHGIIGVSGVDTRALTRHIRTAGAMRAVIAAGEFAVEELLAEARRFPGLVGRDLVAEVTCPAPHPWSVPHPDGAAPPEYRVVAYDCGVKHNILRLLVSSGCQVTVVPARTLAEEVLALAPDGVFLSNGPGDPAGVPGLVREVRRLLDHVPIFGICLGHQLLGLAFGGKTYKMKFGHRGANQPVKDLTTGRVEITAQNHGFCVDLETLPASEIEITHVNLNDQTLEGMRHKTLPVFSVQYHPEAAPGPHDSRYLFGRFLELMKKKGGRPCSAATRPKSGPTKPDAEDPAARGRTLGGR